MGIAAPAETISEESSSGTKNVGTFGVGSTMASPSPEVLGKGTVGTTYKVMLATGVELVVKRLKEVDLRKQEFDLRVTVIGSIQNKHIAPLQKYYWTKDEKLLVYNIFPMGSLAHALHGNNMLYNAQLTCLPFNCIQDLMLLMLCGSRGPGI
jgi:nicotinic acid phosphoribosyltransferase